MSLHYPRRVKDLPTLELDSEEEFNTPQKLPKEIDAVAIKSQQLLANKENEATSNACSGAIGSSTKSYSSFNNLRMYPKRSAELPVLESDSEDDENIRTDNLNCAILNDSFILSPGKSEQDESCASPHNACESSAIKIKREHTDNSFILQFDKMVLNSENKQAQEATKLTESIGKSLHPKTKHTNDQEPRNMISATNGSASSAAGLVQRYNSYPSSEKSCSRRKDINTPFGPIKTETAAAGSVEATTEAQFATPQVRSFSVQRRPRDLCSIQSQKTRSAIVNEFRSQKVLFQTPMTLPRAPISTLPNDSITLSLCDTINEAESAPNTSEKSPKKAETCASGKSTKSLEVAFNEAGDPIPTAEASNVLQPATVKKAISSTGIETSSSSSSVPNKEIFLNINSGTYAILKKLGIGGSSSVYLARRKDNQKECAVKVVDLQGDPAVVEGYLNETKLLAKLQGNICVVALYDYQLLQNESKLYMVMEKGDSDLHKILQTYTTSLPLYVLMNFLYQMMQAVNYIHQNGVIHSDLKPANFLMVNGRLKLIDFGIASNIAIDSTSIIKFSQAGTFNYISPEALTDTSTGSSPMRNNQPKIKISTKSDVWSLGCILYLLLYKKTPFSHIKNIYAKISAISSPTYAIEFPVIPQYYPVMLVHMVKSCLQHNPKKRPSCAELLQYPFHMVIPIQNLAVPSK